MQQDIRDELNRIEGMIEASKGNGELRWWKILQVLCSIALVTILPWGVWVTKQINNMDVEQARFKEWREQSVDHDLRDADRLRLQIKDEIRSEIGVKLDQLSGKLDYVRSDMSELKYQLGQHTSRELQNDKP